MPLQPKITYGNVELDDDEFDPKYVKVRVVLMVDEKTLDIFRKSVGKDRCKEAMADALKYAATRYCSGTVRKNRGKSK
jgi:hypothetical protein